MSIDRLNEIETSGAKSARAEDWILVADRSNAAAEWESLNLLFRYLVADPAVLTSTELALFTTHLQKSLIDAHRIIDSSKGELGLGDYNSLREACRLCAQRCSAVCQSQNMKPEDIPGVKSAHDAAEVLMKFLDEQSNLPLPSPSTPFHVASSTDDGVNNVSQAREAPGTAPLSSCLFPRWQLTADRGEIPDELTGGSSSSHPEMKQLDKLEKAQDIFVNLKIPLVKYTDRKKAPVADVLNIISKVFD